MGKWSLHCAKWLAQWQSEFPAEAKFKPCASGYEFSPLHTSQQWPYGAKRVQPPVSPLSSPTEGTDVLLALAHRNLLDAPTPPPCRGLRLWTSHYDPALPDLRPCNIIGRPMPGQVKPVRIIQTLAGWQRKEREGMDSHCWVLCIGRHCPRYLF